MTYALVNDCTPNNGTIVAISSYASELIGFHDDDTMRAIRLTESASVGDRIAIDWDSQTVNLADCINNQQVQVCGNPIQYDKSGVGHCWVAADEIDCPPSIQDEIACEIIDGGKDDCDDFRASNGVHYRW